MQSSINTIRHVPYVFDLPNSFVRAPNERTDCMILSLLKQNSEWEPLCVVTQNEAISCIKTFWSTYSAPIRAMVFVRLRFGSTVRDRHERVYFSDEIIIDCFVRVCVLTRLHKNHTSFNRGRPTWNSPNQQSFNKHKQKRGPENKNISRNRIHLQSTYTNTKHTKYRYLWFRLWRIYVDLIRHSKVISFSFAHNNNNTNQSSYTFADEIFWRVCCRYSIFTPTNPIRFFILLCVFVSNRVSFYCQRLWTWSPIKTKIAWLNSANEHIFGLLLQTKFSSIMM